MNFPRHQQALKARPDVGFLRPFIPPAPGKRGRAPWRFDSTGELDKTICVTTATHLAVKREAKMRGVRFHALADRLLCRALKSHAPKQAEAVTLHTFSVAKCAIAYQYRLGATLREVGELFGVTRERARQMVKRWEVIMAAHSLNSLGQKRPAQN